MEVVVTVFNFIGATVFVLLVALILMALFGVLLAVRAYLAVKTKILELDHTARVDRKG